MSEQKPSVARSVHYMGHTARGVECMAAIVTQVSIGAADKVGLYVLDPRGPHMIALESGGVQQDEDSKAPHTWHWPERV